MIAGTISSRREEYGHMLTMVRELIEEAPTEAPRAETAEDGPRRSRARSPRCAARDEVERGSDFSMLGRLLADDGCALHLAPPAASSAKLGGGGGRGAPGLGVASPRWATAAGDGCGIW
jgi:hypothetical protein